MKVKVIAKLANSKGVRFVMVKSSGVYSFPVAEFGNNKSKIDAVRELLDALELGIVGGDKGANFVQYPALYPYGQSIEYCLVEVFSFNSDNILKDNLKLSTGYAFLFQNHIPDGPRVAVPLWIGERKKYVACPYKENLSVLRDLTEETSSKNFY